MLEPRMVATSVSRLVDADGPRAAEADEVDPIEGAAPAASVVRRAMPQSPAGDGDPGYRTARFHIAHADGSPPGHAAAAPPAPRPARSAWTRRRSRRAVGGARGGGGGWGGWGGGEGGGGGGGAGGGGCVLWLLWGGGVFLERSR